MLAEHHARGDNEANLQEMGWGWDEHAEIRFIQTGILRLESGWEPRRTYNFCIHVGICRLEWGLDGVLIRLHWNN